MSLVLKLSLNVKLILYHLLFKKHFKIKTKNVYIIKIKINIMKKNKQNLRFREIYIKLKQNTTQYKPKKK